MIYDVRWTFCGPELIPSPLPAVERPPTPTREELAEDLYNTVGDFLSLIWAFLRSLRSRKNDHGASSRTRMNTFSFRSDSW